MKIFLLLSNQVRNQANGYETIAVYVAAWNLKEAKSYWPKDFPIDPSMITALDLSLATEPGVLGVYNAKLD